MKKFVRDVNGLKLSISAFAENIIRVRVSKDFEPTYFEKYNIYTKPDENAGEEVPGGIKCNDLTVKYENGGIIFTTPKCTRVININNSRLNEKNEYFDKKLNGFRPERKKIVGDTSKDEKLEQRDIVVSPVYLTVNTEGEEFYGLGESNVDRLILNGKTYLMRVIYTKSEFVVPFVMTKAGYAISVNSSVWHGVDVCENNKNELVWYLPDGELDFFVYAGDTLKALLERFTYLTGRSMVLPKWAYGLMFIDQYNADQFEVMRNAATFREKQIPCDTFSLEPGWMQKPYDFTVAKKWNTDRFYICDWMRRTEEEFAAHTPAQRMFSTALSRYGFHLILWLCCNYDFTAQQENRAGNTTDFGFEPWFKHLKTFVCDGANGFKLDPCKVIDSASEDRVYANGRPEKEMHSLQTTLYGKEMYEGFSEYTHLRPMHHLSGGYTSIQKFSALTTGDSGGRYKTLVWILNSGLSGVSNMTCDMDIFAKHTIHYCFFTAWCELNSWSGYSHPWWAGDENEKLFTFYDRLRYHILPYVYSAAINAHITGVPVARAMCLEYDEETLKDNTTEYLFGDNYLVGSFSDTIYLPKGEKWIDAWSGKVLDGGVLMPIEVPEDRGGPLYIRNGAVIPTQADKQYTDCKDDKRLTLEVYAVADCGRTGVLYEDDGLTLDYIDGKIARTEFNVTRSGNIVTVSVSERAGGFRGMEEAREYGVKLMTCAECESVTVDGKDAQFNAEEGRIVFDMGTSGKAEIKLKA